MSSLMFWKLPPNPRLKKEAYKVSPEYTPLQWGLLTLVWVIAFPFALGVGVIWKVLETAWLISGSFAFFVMEKLLGRAPAIGSAETFQPIRAYINNILGVHLPHLNAPFRRFLFRLSGITIGRGGFIGMNGYMEDYRPENVRIEDKVTISFGVTFIAHGQKRNMKNEEKVIILRSGCYIGATAVILPGVEVGERAIVGASAVVTKSVPPGAIVAGSPARILGYQEGYGQEGAPSRMGVDGVSGRKGVADEKVTP